MVLVYGNVGDDLKASKVSLDFSDQFKFYQKATNSKL